MANIFIPDNRIERPDLLLPNHKPFGNVRVDWANPLSSQLKLFYLVFGHEVYECVNETWIQQNTASITSDRLQHGGDYGYGNYSNETVFSNPFFTLNTGEISVLGKLYVNDDQLVRVNIHRFANRHFGFYFRCGGASPTYDIYRSGSSFNNISQDANVLSPGSWNSWGHSIQPNRIALYKDGNLVNELTGSFSISNNNSNQSSNLANFRIRANNYFISYFILYNRALSESEFSSVHHDPYRLLIPK